jgi:hypothetical protein
MIEELRFSTGAGKAEADAISAEDWKAELLVDFRTLGANGRAI